MNMPPPSIDQSKPFVSMCSYCQKEFPDVDKSVRDNQNRINFSHGICKRHSGEMLKQMGKTPEQIQAFLAKMDGKVPDLKERSDLKDLYSKGIFTKEDFAQAQQSQQKLTERLKRLANIRS